VRYRSSDDGFAHETGHSSMDPRTK
jgi:hypothetical protein